MYSRLSVRDRASRGIAWSMLGTFGGRAVSLVSLGILARLLAPGDFGLLAFALVFLTYLETVGDLGTSAALVYWPGRGREVAQITFVANIAMGVLWVLVSLILAPQVADFFRSPDGVPVLRTLSFVVLIKSLGNTHDAILQRELRFRARVVPELTLLSAKAITSVLLALLGFGVWSLVWGQLLGQTLATALLWVLVPWRPGGRFAKASLGPILRYGRGIVSVNLIASVVHHVDYVIVGRMLGVAALGVYQMAYKVPDMAVTLIVRISSKVLFPALSRLRDAGEPLAELFFPALRYLTLVAVPATVGMVFMARPIVLTLFGDDWIDAVPILRAIAIYAGLKALGSFTGDILKATGRPSWLAALGLVRAVILVPALVLAAGTSALAVAWVLTMVTGLSTAVNLVIACVLLRVPAQTLWRSLTPGLFATLPLLSFLLLWREVAQTWVPVVDLSLGVLLGLCIYAVSLRVLLPQVFQSLVGLVRHRPRKEGRGEVPPSAARAIP